MLDGRRVGLPEKGKGEAHLGLASCGTREQSFAGAGGTHEKGSSGYFSAELKVSFRAFQEGHELHDLLLGFIASGHIIKLGGHLLCVGVGGCHMSRAVRRKNRVCY